MARRSQNPPQKPPRGRIAGRKAPSPSGAKRPPQGPGVATVPTPGAKSQAELQADAAIRDAYRLYAVQEFRRAKSLLDQVIAHVPRHADAYHLRADVLSRGMLDAKAAQADLAAAEAILGPNAETDRRRAELLLRMGDDAGAEAAARACLTRAPAKVEAYETLAKLSGAPLTEADQAAMLALAKDDGVAPGPRREIGRAHV